MANGTITPTFLSESSYGTGIKVAATSSSGTLLHTAGGTSVIDVVTLTAVNTDSTARLLTIEFGGLTDPDDHIEVLVGPQRGLVVVADRMRISNSLEIRAYAAAADVIVIFGEVDRITLPS